MRLVILFVAAFSISTPAVMYFSTGEATLNLFVEGFWIIGLLQALAFTTIVDYCTESKHTNMLNNPACNDEDWDNDMLNNPACNDEDWDNDMLNNPAYSWSMFNIHHSD
ncbi:protein Exp2 [Neisseria gonorrhoeae]